MKYPTRIKIAFLVLLLSGASSYRNEGFAQQGNTLPTPGYGGYDWMPDCSHEGTPLPTGKVNLHRYQPDNVGTPDLDNPELQSYRGNALLPYPLLDHSFDAAPNGDLMMVVSEDRPGDVFEDPSGAANFFYGYSQIKLRKIDPTATPNRITDSVIVNDGSGVATLPRISKTSTGYYYVSWKEHNASGERIRYMIYDGSLTQYGAGPNSLSGSHYFATIEEYSATADDSGRIAFIVRANGKELYAQLIDLTGAHWTDDPDYAMEEISGDEAGSGGNTFSPIVNYNRIVNQYEFFWGDDFNNPSPDVVDAQVFNNTGSHVPTRLLAAGGAPNYSMTISSHSYFYAKTCKGYVGSGSTDLGETVILYQDNSATPVVKLRGELVSRSWGGAIMSLNVTSGGFTASNLCALSKRPLSSTLDEPVVLCYDNTNGRIVADGADVITGVVWNWTGCIAQSVASNLYQSFIVTSPAIFVAVPDVSKEYLYRIDVSGSVGTFNGATTLNVRSQTSPANAGPAYFVASSGTTKLSLLNYQYGQLTDAASVLLSAVSDDDAYEDLPRDLDGRGASMPWSTYDFNSYTISTGSTPYTASGSIAVEDPTIDHGAHTALWHNIRATVYEEYHYDVTNDLLLGYRIGVSGAEQAPIVVESATTGSLFENAKCAVIYDAVNMRNIAVVTYEVSVPATSTASYKYKVINLDTRGVITTPTTLLTLGSARFRYKNCEPVYDSINNDFLFFCIDREAFKIYAIGFDYSGSPLPWLGGNVRLIEAAPFPNQVNELATCFNPDPTGGSGANFGAYVTWREYTSTQSEINLTAVSSQSGTSGPNWTAGIYSHCPSLTSLRALPVVCAGQSWVFNSWMDWQIAASPSRPRIFGTAHSNTGSLMSGWNVNGTNLTTNSTTGWEAVNPSMVEDPGTINTAILAYEFDTDPIALSKSIELEKVPLTGTLTLSPVALGLNPALMTYPAGFAATDAVNSMVGYYERKPKLRLQNPSVDLGFLPSLTPHVMCAYQTMGYNSSAIATWELNHFNISDHVPYQESNISAVLLQTTNLKSIARYCIAHNTNAQDLTNVYWSDEQGFVVRYLDYVGSDNHNGIVKTVDANLEIRDHNDFSSTGYNLHWGGPSSTNNFRVYNNSLIDLWLDGSIASTSCKLAPPASNTWTIGGGLGTLTSMNSQNWTCPKLLDTRIGCILGMHNQHEYGTQEQVRRDV